MSLENMDPRIDRLYDLLPAIYRMRDADQQYPLRALLRVIAEQANLIEDDIGQLYENWFIETAEDWAVPYIADLIGYRPVLDVGDANNVGTQEGRDLNRVLVPRREVANTIRYRRRKGTLPLLELLAGDVAGLPVRAVEFFKLLGWNQNINHLHLDRARTTDVRRVEELDLIDGPFDVTAHTVDVRQVNSHRTIGRYNIPSVGVFVWWLKAYSVTRSRAYCAENAGPHCYTFSVLGQDAALVINPEPETDPYHIAGEFNVPAPIRRLEFARHPERFYGSNKSIEIWAAKWGNYDSEKPIPLEAIIPADLSDWQYLPPLQHIAVDPVLGRFAFPPSQLPKTGVRVTYHYAFSADMGGGEYRRTLFDPSDREVEVPDPKDASKRISTNSIPIFYRVGKQEKFRNIGAALDQWRLDNPFDAVIELTESSVYVEPLSINLEADHTLQVRAANAMRPVIRLLDWQTDSPDALAVTMGEGSRLTMDGLLVAGRPLQVMGPERENPQPSRAPVCGSEVVIRHCTFVPGWGIDRDCKPNRPAEPSLQVHNLRARLRIEHSILGSIQIHEDEVNIDPIPVQITDSIIDATTPQKEAIGAPGSPVAHIVLTIQRCTVFGIVDVHAVALAEDTIFNDCLNVARRQLGCVRFSYVPRGCRTPRRYHCQPDLVTEAAMEIADPLRRAALILSEGLRVRPQFTSIRYGNAAYAQLALTCAVEIKQGAQDESEMGAFHDLFQPQREANLRQRLAEYTPAGMNVGLLYPT